MKNRQQLTGAQTLVAMLRAHRVDTIFGIPGVHTLPIYDALRNEPDIRHILARHEQGAGFMAEGYARATGRPGVVCTITGPGVTNVATPMASAYADSVPLLVISSSLSRSSLTHAPGELHEVKHQFGVMEALAGWSRIIQHVEEIPEALNEAFQIMHSGRPRGAYLQLPIDILSERAEVELLEPEPAQLLQPAEDVLQQAFHLLTQAQRPVIIAGAGVTAARGNRQLQQLAEQLQAPVILGSKSHDVLPTQHPLVLTTSDNFPTELQDFLRQSDLALVIGSKLGAERTASCTLPLPETLIHIDIDASVIGHNYPATLGIVADARLTMEALLCKVAMRQHQATNQSTEIKQVRTALAQATRQIHGESFTMLEGLQAGLPQESIVVADMTLLSYASAQYLPVTEPRTFIHPAEFCTIGCGLPLALGARVGVPDRPVIALCGDGGFLLNASELATAAQEQIPVVIVIFNDATFATVKKEQQKSFGARYIATDLLAPDYVALARAFHIESLRVNTPEALRIAVCEAAQRTTATVIEAVLPARHW
ncbi:thiamine pyrophosphate-binding protein [Tengunoibacter tsumagoiensis]|uniref:Putative 2-ketoarginine decarboxylase AruI n=1 Tax=Tengunoibacter tsumagoiensis TaxID=2014871 RepID=A0A402A5W2_9CHLR|nr:thiamine pyrophosphate-binding protein [Tengunoibacter tsumagoiensis]GCE14426.1 putative 2-ketoarginine decarboxylase AruI [Tengunoibacter tsumagoiensis]